MRFYRTLALFVLILTLLTCITTTLAQRLWTGNTNTDWGTASNWSPAFLPGDDEDIIIPGVRPNYPILLVGRKMKSLTIESGGTITFTGGTTTVDVGAVNNSGTIIVNGGTLDIKDGTVGTLSNSGTITLSRGQLKVASLATNLAGANFNHSGGTFEANNLTVNASSNVTFSTGTMAFNSDITNSGTVTSSSGTLTLNGLIANQSGAIFTVNGGDVEVKQEPSTNEGTINVMTGNLFFNSKDLQNLSGGTLAQTGGTLQLDHLYNDGQVTASAGTFTIDEYFTNSSGNNITVDGGSIIVKNNTSTNAGSITVSSGLLDSATACKNLTIQAGGSVTQTGGIASVKKLIVDATGSYTFSGTTLDITGDLVNSGTVTLNPGTVNVAGKIITEIGSEFTIAGAMVTAGDNATFAGTVNISDGTLDLGTDNKIAFVDGGTFNQSGGSLITENLELKNGSTYNQTGGELQVAHDLKVPAGTTFNSTGGTVHFTGSAGGGADYRGNVHFHNVVIDDGVNPGFDNDGGPNINISGDYTNYNPSLDLENATFTFNGTEPQTIYSESTPAATNTTFGNLIVTNPNGVSLLTDLGVETSFSYNSGGYLDLNGNTLYVGGSVYGGPLPVELSSFSAVILENGVKLKWRTETEVSNYGFEIERGQRSKVKSQTEWIKIGFVEGYGNSNSPKDYSFVDVNITAGKPAYRTGKYSYRLKQVDTDGKFEYSKVIEVDLGSPVNFELSQNYPNPFNPSTTIRFSLTESSFINLTIFNSLGEKVEELVNEVKEPGIHTIEFNAEDLPSGTYFYRLQANYFTQIKKMILVK
jgi:hypothetical protein